jgi:hypothetical protein
VLCWFQSSVVGWVTNLVTLAMLLGLAAVYQRPGTWLLGRPFAWVYPLCGLAGLASVVRVSQLGWPHLSSTAFSVVIFCAVLAAYLVVGLREPGHASEQVVLALPFSSGRWVVSVGGVTALNHHVVHAAQIGALDLVGVRRDGTRADGVSPERLEDYESFGREVVSPCDGIVVEAVDGVPDELPQRKHRHYRGGNLLRIDTGHETVTLAHLRCGSLAVSVGAEVVAGQPLAEVGSSGGSAEPHLHIHAERAGRGLRLRFRDSGERRPRPGLVLDADAEARLRHVR